MAVRVDAAGNLRGLYGDSSAPRLLIGSHLDTVPDAGAFDGVLGVAIGIALAEMRPRIAIEVVGFSEEEGVRFGFPFIGSRALVGTLEEDPRVWDAIRAFGLDPAEMPNARFAPQSIGYVEFHIEQGPVLESMNRPLGIVDTIVGQSRFHLTFAGKAGHAGTTPMELRRDALAGAAEWILCVESCAKKTPGLVATVGSIEVSPNAGNVIAGEARATLDVRHRDDARRHDAALELIGSAREICAFRGLTLRHEQKLDQPAVAMTMNLPEKGLLHMTSGAGHDAMILAPHMPTGMVFLRSPGGISHHPGESVLEADVTQPWNSDVKYA